MIALMRLPRDARVRWMLAGLLVLFAAALPPLAGLYEMANPDVSARFYIFLGTDRPSSVQIGAIDAELAGLET